MKKWILSLALMSGLTVAYAESTHVLLQYDMGNQITRSGLIVLSNGKVLRQESLMGQITYLEDQKLSNEAVQELTSQIDLAASSEAVSKDNIDAAEGGAYGEVKIFTSTGSFAYLYTLGSSKKKMKKALYCQQGVAADAIRAFVQERVTSKMPLEMVPCRE